MVEKAASLQFHTEEQRSGADETNIETRLKDYATNIYFFYTNYTIYIILIAFFLEKVLSTFVSTLIGSDFMLYISSIVNQNHKGANKYLLNAMCQGDFQPIKDVYTITLLVNCFTICRIWICGIHNASHVCNASVQEEILFETLWILFSKIFTAPNLSNIIFFIIKLCYMNLKY